MPGLPAASHSKVEFVLASASERSMHDPETGCDESRGLYLAVHEVEAEELHGLLRAVDGDHWNKIGASQTPAAASTR
jgi:hypothetical protein